MAISSLVPPRMRWNNLTDLSQELVLKLRSVVARAGVVIGLGLILSGCASEPVSEESFAPFELSGSDPEFGENMVACLNESGWDVELADDGGVTATIPETSNDSYSAAVEDCSKSLGYDNPPPMSDEQYGKLYGALVELVDCLSDEGYTVTDVPSEQAFRDGAVFDPYGELYAAGEIAGADFAELQATCPQP